MNRKQRKQLRKLPKLRSAMEGHDAEGMPKLFPRELDPSRAEVYTPPVAFAQLAGRFDRANVAGIDRHEAFAAIEHANEAAEAIEPPALTPRQIAARKAAATRKAKREVLEAASFKLKTSLLVAEGKLPPLDKLK